MPATVTQFRDLQTLTDKFRWSFVARGQFKTEVVVADDVPAIPCVCSDGCGNPDPECAACESTGWVEPA